MNKSGPHGHVSRQRLLGEGSAFVRQLAQAQQADDQQQKGSHQRPKAHDGASSDTEPGEPAVIAFNELWNARTTAHHVCASAAESTDRLLGVQLWWPPAPEPTASKAVQAAGGKRYKAARVQFLQHSTSLAQIMHYQGQAVRGSREPASARHLAACRGWAAKLLGPPGGSQPTMQHSSETVQTNIASSNWACCNKPYPDEAPGPARVLEAVASVAVCGHLNSADADRCCECGAARWAGADGQLAQRLMAVMQTSDLGTTGMRQVVTRVATEAGSHPALGLQLQPGAVKAGVDVCLARRRAAVASRAPVAAAVEAVPTPGGASAAADSVGLYAPGLHAAAGGVFQSLISWHLRHHSKVQLHSQQKQHQQQQQQQSQHQQLRQVHQIHVAAAATAALLPQLLTAVYSDCNGLQQQGLVKSSVQHQVPPALHIWVADVLEQAAAEHKQPSNNSGSKSQQKVSSNQLGSSSRRVAVAQPLPVHCPMPSSTLQQLLDRRTAVLRQQVIDYAQQLARHGQLPVVKRTLCFASDEGDSLHKNVLYSEDMPVWEWLWTQKYLTVTTDYLCKDIVKRAKLPGEGSIDEVAINHHITCDDWPGVKRVRRHLQHITTTWLCTSTPNLAATASTLQRALLEVQLQHRLIMQQQQLPHAWGTAPPFALREALGALSAQYSQQQQKGHHNTSTAGVPAHSKPHAQEQVSVLEGRRAASAAATMKQAQKAPGSQPADEASVNNRRKRGREQLHDDAGADGEQKVGEQAHQGAQPVARSKTKAMAAAAAAHGRTAAAGLGRKTGKQEATAGACSPPLAHETGSGSVAYACINGAASAECTGGVRVTTNHLRDGQSCDHVGQATSHNETLPLKSGSLEQAVAADGQSHGTTPGHPNCDESMAEYNLYLASLDDLLVLNPAEMCQAFHVRPGGAWRPVSKRGEWASSTPRSRTGPGSEVVGVCGCHELPAGMQAILRHAAAVGTSSAVLRRTVARLRQMFAACCQ